MEITVTEKFAFVDGKPDLFLTPIQAAEHMDSWMNTPMDVNLEADAYAEPEVDHSYDQVINYDCTAWH
jgi:hypothetical protein